MASLLMRWFPESASALSVGMSAGRDVQLGIPTASISVLMRRTRIPDAINGMSEFVGAAALQARLWREMSWGGYAQLGIVDSAGVTQYGASWYRRLASARVALAQALDDAQLGSARAGSLSLSWQRPLSALIDERLNREPALRAARDARASWLAAHEMRMRRRDERERRARVTPSSDVLQLASERACALSWEYTPPAADRWSYLYSGGSAQRARDVAARMADARASWNVAHGRCGCGARTICAWNKRDDARATRWHARSCDGMVPSQPSSELVSATLVHSGMIGYWGGDSRRWDDDAGCVFAQYSRETTLAELIDELADDYDSGGDCDSFPESIERDEVHDALCAMLSERGWRDYWSDAPCEYAQEYADVNPCEHDDGRCRCDDDELPSIVVLLELQDGAYPMLAAADTHHGTLYSNDEHERGAAPGARAPAQRELQRSATSAQLASCAQSAIAIKLQERWPTCTSFHQCPYCHDGIDPCAPAGKLVMCERCDTLHHADCYQHHGCTVLGCDGRAERDASAAPTADADERWADDESPYGSPSYHSHAGSNAQRDMWYAPSALQEAHDDYVGRCNRDAFLQDHGHLPCVVRHRSGVAIYLGCSCDAMGELAESCNALQDYPLYDEDAESDARCSAEDDAWEDWARDDFKRELEQKFSGLQLDDVDDDELAEFFHAAMERSNTYWEMEGDGAYIRLEELVWGCNGRLGHPLQSADDGISLDDIIGDGIERYHQSAAQLSSYVYEHPSADELSAERERLWRERAERWASSYRHRDALRGRAELSDGESERWAREFGSWQELQALRRAGELMRYRWRGFKRQLSGPMLPGEHRQSVIVKLSELALSLKLVRERASR